jgi:hypothetical protein
MPQRVGIDLDGGISRGLQLRREPRNHCRQPQPVRPEERTKPEAEREGNYLTQWAGPPFSGRDLLTLKPVWLSLRCAGLFAERQVRFGG